MKIEVKNENIITAVKLIKKELRKWDAKITDDCYLSIMGDVSITALLKNGRLINFSIDAYNGDIIILQNPMINRCSYEGYPQTDEYISLSDFIAHYSTIREVKI